MINDKKILVVGAGNAGRPAANLLNYLGNEITITDIKPYSELPKKAQRKIAILEERGINFDLGQHTESILDSSDAVYISHNIPKNSVFIKKIQERIDNDEIQLITSEDIGKILNSLIAIPMIGIAGTDGKTTTTNMINYELMDNFNTLVFSSLQDSLVIEGLVELVTRSSTKKEELAVLELPHGTIRMAKGLELDVAILTNLSPDHMDEFNSYEDYITRNIAIEKLLKDNGLLIVNGDDPIISTRLDTFTHDYIIYALKKPQKIQFEGSSYYNEDVDYDVIAKDIKLNGINGSKFKFILKKEIPTLVCKNCNEINCSCNDYERKIIEPFEKEIEIIVPGLVNVENTLATIISSLIFGISIEDSFKRIAIFNGVKGRFEKIAKLDDINIFMDAAHNPESMEKLFNGLDLPGRLIISLDNPDTLTVRDKYKIGEVLSKYADILIVSSKNETTEVLDPEASYEVIKGVEDSLAIEGIENNLAIEGHNNKDTKTHITDSVVDSILYGLKIAKSNDTIIHIGPGVVNAYNNVRNDINEAIEFYKAISGKVVVIGGCGTVGSLIARVLNDYEVDITISDSAKDTKLRDIFKKEDIKLDLGGHDEKLLKSASSFFIAPSLYNNSKLIVYLKSINDVPILSVDEIFKYIPTNKLIFGITGTNGKTTTVNILKNIFKTAGLDVGEHMLDIQGNTELIPGLQSRLKGDVGVVEIGTFGKKGEIKKSAKIADVDTGIITNVSKDHLIDNDFNSYIDCKKEITIADNLILNADDPIVSSFASLKNKDDICYFGIEDSSFNNDNRYFDDYSDDSLDSNNHSIDSNSYYTRNCPLCANELKYSNSYLGHLGNYSCECGFSNPDLDVKAKDIKINNDGYEYTLEIANPEEDYPHESKNKGKIILKGGGIANVYNSLAAATAAWLSGIDFEDIVKGINTFEGVPGRFEILSHNPKIILDYAHNPAGVQSIIQSVLLLDSFDDGNNYSKNKLIILNTISSESGKEGDLKIAKILSKGDIVIPVSNTAYKYSKYIDTDLEFIDSKEDYEKTGTTGASYNQVKKAIELSLEIANSDDTILIIGEAGIKYTKDALDELDFNI